MPQGHYARMSKTKAINNMASSVERPVFVFVDTEKEIIKLRISNSLWNACEPQSHRITKPLPKCLPKPQSKVKRSARVSRATEAPAKIYPTSIHSSPRQCKSRFFRFHYGGAKRQKRGDRQNEITYEAPCLQPTCMNCWKWNPHLVSTDEDMHPIPQPSVELMSPVNERSVDATQPTRKRRHDSVFSVSEDLDLTQSHHYPHHKITTLAFRSREGKKKYASLMHANEAKQKRENWCLERSLRDASPQSTGSDSGSVWSAKSGSSSGRSRHRVRLIFKNEIGKGDFGRLVQRYLC